MQETERRSFFRTSFFYASCVFVAPSGLAQDGPSGVSGYDYRFILDASRKANPKLKIILLDPFVLPTGKLLEETAWKRWNGECTKLRAIVKRLASDYQAAHLRTQEVFDTACEHTEPSHWIWDGVHPLPQGHELIARSWIETVHQQFKD